LVGWSVIAETTVVSLAPSWSATPTTKSGTIHSTGLR